MVQLSVTLSDEARRFAELQAAECGYGSAAEYIATLVESTRTAAGKGDLEQLLLAAVNSGEAREVSEDWFEQKKREWLAKYADRKAS